MPLEHQALVSRATRGATEWQRVLGHPDERRVEKLFQDESLGIKAVGAMEPCSDCAAGKAQHVEHPKRDGQDAKEVGERVHVDLGFITNKEKASYDYYMLCKDQFSEYCLIYFMESKDQVHDNLIKLIIHFECGGHPIREIASDNGSEFVNRANELLFMKERINHQTSTPYIPQQNGTIEREMRTINNAARTLLCQAGLKKDPLIIREALRTACYLKNRVPTARSNLTPFERFIGRKPRLTHLVEFGAQVQVLDNGHRLSKFESKTIPAFIVGFTNRSNTYRVYIPSLNRVTESCDVYFRSHVTGKRGDTEEAGHSEWRPTETDDPIIVRTSSQIKEEPHSTAMGRTSNPSMVDDYGTAYSEMLHTSTPKRVAGQPKGKTL